MIKILIIIFFLMLSLTISGCGKKADPIAPVSQSLDKN